MITRGGQRIGVGDRIATRRNDRHLDVANRDTWTVTAVGTRGLLVTAGPAAGDRPHDDVTPSDAAVRVLPADYVTDQVELAYASTVHGVQGDTVTAAHLVIGSQTGAAAAYVGMTRGREVNTAHLAATDIADARDQWIAVFGRDRADLGPSRAAERADQAAGLYAQPQSLDETGRPGDAAHVRQPSPTHLASGRARGVPYPQPQYLGLSPGRDRTPGIGR